MQGSIYLHCSCLDPETGKPYRRGKRDGQWWSDCPRWNERGHRRYGYVVGIRKIGPGRWEQRRKQGFPTRKAAEEALTGVIGDVRAGTVLSNAQRRITVGEWADTWLAGRVRLRPATVRGYRLAIRDYIRPGLGRIPLVELNTATVEAWLGRIRTGQLKPVTRPEGAQVTASTVNLQFAILRAMLSTAVKRQMIARNPCTGAELEDSEPAEARIWTRPEVAEFLAYLGDAQPPWAAVAYRLAAVYGLRRGEIAALRWSDITTDAITVRRNAVAVGAEVITGPLKSKRGRDSRTLPLALDPGMPAVLAAARKRQLTDRMASGEDWQGGEDWRDQGLVVADQLGAAIPPWRLTDEFRRLAEAAGLPVIRLHDARHTAGTHMYRATRDLKKVQRWMGHATAAVTADLYVHDTDETDAAAAGQMAAYLAQ